MKRGLWRETISVPYLKGSLFRFSCFHWGQKHSSNGREATGSSGLSHLYLFLTFLQIESKISIKRCSNKNTKPSFTSLNITDNTAWLYSHSLVASSHPLDCWINLPGHCLCSALRSPLIFQSSPVSDKGGETDSSSSLKTPAVQSRETSTHAHRAVNRALQTH